MCPVMVFFFWIFDSKRRVERANTSIYPGIIRSCVCPKWMGGLPTHKHAARLNIRRRMKRIIRANAPTKPFNKRWNDSRVTMAAVLSDRRDGWGPNDRCRSNTISLLFFDRFSFSSTKRIWRLARNQQFTRRWLVTKIIIFILYHCCDGRTTGVKTKNEPPDMVTWTERSIRSVSNSSTPAPEAAKGWLNRGGLMRMRPPSLVSYTKPRACGLQICAPKRRINHTRIRACTHTYTRLTRSGLLLLWLDDYFVLWREVFFYLTSMHRRGADRWKSPHAGGQTNNITTYGWITTCISRRLPESRKYRR